MFTPHSGGLECWLMGGVLIFGISLHSMCQDLNATIPHLMALSRRYPPSVSQTNRHHCPICPLNLPLPPIWLNQNETKQNKKRYMFVHLGSLYSDTVESIHHLQWCPWLLGGCIPRIHWKYHLTRVPISMFAIQSPKKGNRNLCLEVLHVWVIFYYVHLFGGYYGVYTLQKSQRLKTPAQAIQVSSSKKISN